MFRLEVALEGMKRSEDPISEGALVGVRCREVGVLLELKLPLEHSSRVDGKKCCLGDMFNGLGHAVEEYAVMIGVGRKMEVSRVIPGGGTSLAGADAVDDAEEGARGGVEALARFVFIGDGIASRLAYRRSSLYREGEGMGTRTERLERPDKESSDL